MDGVGVGRGAGCGPITGGGVGDGPKIGMGGGEGLRPGGVPGLDVGEGLGVEADVVLLTIASMNAAPAGEPRPACVL